MSILDETLGGLRVIKAFNAEKILRTKFFHTNDTLNHIRNKMNFRRDLASPMSAVLGSACSLLYTLVWWIIGFE
jgi:subfamily B ATP-binding cassette protein MsbA